jgi:NADPH:quinone reductase-like Zn-dependent oxidoreductase
MSAIQFSHKTLVDIPDLQKNDVALITAASRGVGHLAALLARYLGASRRATCRR